MRIRTFSDGIISEASRYDLILAALPLPLFLGVAVGTLTGLPASPVVGVSGLVSVSVLAYGLFVATPKTPATPERTTPFDAVDTSLDAIDGARRDETGGRRRRRGV